MTDRSIRDIVLSIEKVVSPLLKGANPASIRKGKTFPHRFPKALSPELRDIADLVLDDIKKPFNITEFTNQVCELAASEGVQCDNNGEMNRTLRYFLCEKVGLKPTYRKGSK